VEKDKRPVKTLWIHPRKILFTGLVTVDDGWEAGWKVGIIQSIFECKRNGHYEDGRDRFLKLDTSMGPLKDGEDNELFYPGSEGDLEEGLTTVSCDDEPNFELPVSIDGKKLLRTSGRDKFRSVLALAREEDKSVVLLSSIAWRINWEGTYDAAKEEWTESNTEELFFASYPLRREEVYPQLKGRPVPVFMPVSLFKAQAEDAGRINLNGQWQACNVTGNTGKGRADLNLSRWNE
jgi:hypothetical protein